MTSSPVKVVWFSAPGSGKFSRPCCSFSRSHPRFRSTSILTRWSSRTSYIRRRASPDGTHIACMLVPRVRIGMPQNRPVAGISQCLETGSADPHRRAFEPNGQESMIEATACAKARIPIVRVALSTVANAGGAKCAMVMRPFLSLSAPFGPLKSSSAHCGGNPIPGIGQSRIFPGITRLPH
jgi:hypothetical protein